ncbi:MAG: single-stranded DNA-binding protein [Clostridia bacterium]|nr:single-stranded DNA-binding protein [Clostridia bacterium]MBQ9879399.1 single-stranded DNA-binding protein [Clostridia bacterium]
MLNSIIIQGRLVDEPEYRTTQTGVNVTTFRIACDRNVARTSNNPGQQTADFINCVAWRQTGEFVSKYFHKGSMILVQGSLQVRSYDDKNGVRRTVAEVQCDRVHFCGSKNESGGSQFSAEQNPLPAQQNASYQNATAEDFAQTPPDEDDLPF